MFKIGDRVKIISGVSFASKEKSYGIIRKKVDRKSHVWAVRTGGNHFDFFMKEEQMELVPTAFEMWE